jgi:hypothetical protein
VIRHIQLSFTASVTETVIVSKFILTTPWRRVLPEKLKRPKLLKKFPEFYGTRRFVTASQELATCPYPQPD